MKPKFDNLNETWLNAQLANDYSSLFISFEQLFKPRFSVSQIGISRQELLYWKKQNLTDDSNQSDFKTWTRVNFYEYCWLRLVAHMRKMNFPTNSIKKFKDKLNDVDEDTIVKSIRSAFEAQKENPDLKKMLSDLNLENIIKIFPPSIIQEFKRQFSPFNQTINKLIISRQKINILVNLEGDFQVLLPELLFKFELDSEYLKFFDDSFISIPLHNVLSEFYSNPMISISDQKDIFQLSEREAKILELFRKEGIKSIFIKRTEDQKRKIMVEIVEEKKIPATEKKIRSLLDRNKFQNIRLYSENGNLILFEETTKLKL